MGKFYFAREDTSTIQRWVRTVWKFDEILLWISPSKHTKSRAILFLMRYYYEFLHLKHTKSLAILFFCIMTIWIHVEKIWCRNQFVIDFVSDLPSPLTVNLPVLSYQKNSKVSPNNQSSCISVQYSLWWNDTHTVHPAYKIYTKVSMGRSTCWWSTNL